MKYNCVIVEDEPLAQERLIAYISKMEALHLSSVFDNSLDALVYVKTNTVDLVFLDIHVGGISGIQLLETADLNAAIILTTAYHEYAVKGYELSVVDYLLKPFSFERFTTAIDKALISIDQKKDAANKPNYFFIKTAYKVERVDYDALLYIEGMRDYRKICTYDKQLMTLQTFKELEETLDAAKVCRVHKSYMVNLSKVDSINKDEIKIGNSIVYLSDTYRAAFYKKLVLKG